MNRISQPLKLARTILAAVLAGTLAFGAMAAEQTSTAVPVSTRDSAPAAMACDGCDNTHGADASSAGADTTADTTTPPTMAALAAMQTFRSAAPRRADSARARWLARPGMRVVLRVPLVDFIAHPDSGDMLFTTRTKLLKGSIASARVAVAVAWTY